MGNLRTFQPVGRGADWSRVTLDAIAVAGGTDPAKLVAFNDVFEQLIEHDPQAGEIPRLRIFAGLTVPEIAAVMNGVDWKSWWNQRAVVRRWLAKAA